MDLSFVFVIGAMFLVMWLFLIRPNQQRARRHAEMIAAVKPGDEIVTTGGLYGDVTGVEDDRFTVEIAEDVEVEIAKQAVATVVPQGSSEDEATDDGRPAAEPAVETSEDAPTR